MQPLWTKKKRATLCNFSGQKKSRNLLTKKSCNLSGQKNNETHSTKKTQPLGTKKLQNLSGQKNHATSWDKIIIQPLESKQD